MLNLNRPIWPTSYSPSPVIPKWFRRGLAHIGGKTLQGKPVYRVIWAMDARAFRNGNPRAIKYVNPNDTNLGYACFWLERWASPEFFNRVHWNAMRFSADESGKLIDLLGPFPMHGDYIGVAPLMKDDEHGEPYEMMELTSALLEELQRRLAPGAQKESAMGIVEAQERVKRAKSAALVEKGLEEVRAHYRTHKEEINARASRSYVGLQEGRVPLKDHLRTSALA